MSNHASSLFITIRASLLFIAIASTFAARGDRADRIEIRLRGCTDALPQSIHVFIDEYGLYEATLAGDRYSLNVPRSRGPGKTLQDDGVVASIRFGSVRTSCMKSQPKIEGRLRIATFEFGCVKPPTWSLLKVQTGTSIDLHITRDVMKYGKNTRPCIEQNPDPLIESGDIDIVARTKESIYLHFGSPLDKDTYKRSHLAIVNGIVNVNDQPLGDRPLTLKRAQIVNHYQKTPGSNTRDILDATIKDVTFQVAK